MQKKLITQVCLAALCMVLAIGFLSCGTAEPARAAQAAQAGIEPKDVTVFYGEVGVENHSYFPYAEIGIKSGKLDYVHMGEAFSPTGKLVVETNTGTAANMYRNPWYPNINGTLKAQYAGLGNTGVESLPKADRHYIKIGPQVFVLTITAGNQDIVNVRAVNILVFRQYFGDNETPAQIAAGIVLSDRYLAANMEWYITAIRNNQIFACDKDGNRRTSAISVNGIEMDFASCPVDGAFLKNDAGSTYFPSRGLEGKSFTAVCNAIAAFILDNDGKIEFEFSANGGNWENLRIKGFNYQQFTSGFNVDVVTTASSRVDTTYLRYGASYAKVALKAISIAFQSAFH